MNTLKMLTRQIHATVPSQLSVAMVLILLPLMLLSQSDHRDPTHNFTVVRLLILNDANELLMAREDYVWATPSMIFNQRQFANEALDSLANAYGLQVEDIELRGYFGYKYDYHPHATARAYYVARYTGGELKVPAGMDEATWLPVEEALAKTTVTAMKTIKRQILLHPNTVWGGSFMVSRNPEGHPTEQVEAFYPLFQR